MVIDKFSKHIFWSYNDDADLPDNVIIRQVSLYGNLKDMVLLSKLYSKNKILSVLGEFKNKYYKRIFFIKNVILS